MVSLQCALTLKRAGRIYLSLQDLPALHAQLRPIPTLGSIQIWPPKGGYTTFFPATSINFILTNGDLTPLGSASRPICLLETRKFCYRDDSKAALVGIYARQTDSSMYVLHSCWPGSRSLIFLTRIYMVAGNGDV